MRPKGSAAVLEARRRRAIAMVEKGMSLREAARRMGCHPSSVSRWWEAFRGGGAEGLRVRVSPGRPAKLSARQKRRLVEALVEGPLAHGYATDLWTTRRITALIGSLFGVGYHPDHVGRILHALDWTPQMPERRAAERDEEAIARWKHEDWPRIKKKRGGWAPISYSSTNRGSC